MKKNQNGFAILQTVLALVVIVIVAFVGWYIYNANAKASDTYNSATNTANQPVVTSKKYLTIKEWGVKIPLTGDISDAYYVYNSSSDSVMLSLNKYKGTDCAADSVSLGMIVSSDSSAIGAVKVGDHYYQYSHPQAGCFGTIGNSTSSDIDTTAGALANAEMLSFKNATNNIVVAN